MAKRRNSQKATDSTAGRRQKVPRVSPSEPDSSTVPESAQSRLERIGPINRDRIVNLLPPGTDLESWASQPDGTGKKGLAEELPPLSSLPEIYKDLTAKAFLQDMGEALDGPLRGKKITIATMCSGTESPLIALEHVKEACEASGVPFEFEHVFSSEIVPFKQAFIERNFRPKHIFRDVTKIIPGEKCETAYGPPAEVPGKGSVLILVAGFSCVDFSCLNNVRRGLEIDPGFVGPKEGPIDANGNENTDGRKESKPGESSATFSAIYRYANNARPPIIILENVCGAPWELLVDQFDQIGYASAFQKLDSKDYYIPHTRNRGYMVCVNYRDASAEGMDKEGALKMATDWSAMMNNLKRRASSSVEDFLLDEDSPALQKSMRDLAVMASNVDRKPIDWSRCEQRHRKYRLENALGESNPFTNWKSGRSKAPDYAEKGWHKAQPDRVKDTFDLINLHLAKDDIDMEFKTRFPDVSQNVDRNLAKTTEGVAGCVTPMGCVYNTFRGGPLVGLEALSLQGLPIRKLHLTREQQRDLIDLAGNAMTSTVVGAALLSAITCAARGFPDFGPDNLSEEQTLRPTRLDVDETTLEEREPNFDAQQRLPLRDLLQHAQDSACHCECENYCTISSSPIYRCKSCGTTACKLCKGKPEHNFEPIPLVISGNRNPSDFERQLRNSLPKLLSLNFSKDMFLGALNPSDSTAYRSVLDTMLDHCFHEQFAISSVKRTKRWTVAYEASLTRLELTLEKSRAQWRLFVKCPPTLPVDSPLRALLQDHVAQMTPLLDSSDFLDGQWEVCSRSTAEHQIRATGKGNLIASWRKSMGLLDFLNEQVYTELDLSFKDEPDQDIRRLVEGTYQLLPNCGTANRLLHRKISRPTGTDNSDMYLFLDPSRIGLPHLDQMVLANDNRRSELSGRRDVIATLDYSKQPSKSPWRPVGRRISMLTLKVKRTSRLCDARLSVATLSGSSFKLPRHLPTTSTTFQDACQSSDIILLSCTAPWSGADPNGLYRGGNWLIDEFASQTSKFNGLWLTQSLPHPLANSNTWIDVPSSCIAECRTCVPQRPGIKWVAEARGKLATSYVLKPREDTSAVPDYERNFKSRPSPITVAVEVDRSEDPPTSTVRVYANPKALVHRAVGLFPGRTGENLKVTRALWRLNTIMTRNVGPRLPDFVYSNNDKDVPTPFTFPGKGIGKQGDLADLKLRPEQERSLTWLQSRDCRDVNPFEEEVFEESANPSLGYRLEAKAVRPVNCRGGVVADQVGFGKTITMLALALRTMKEAEAERTLGEINGCISVRATCILAPPTLTPQWRDEIHKFWPACKLVYLNTWQDLRKQSIQAIKDADIVLTSSEIPNHHSYLGRIAELAALPKPPPSWSSPRELDAWLNGAVARLDENIKQLQGYRQPSKFPSYLKDKLRAFEEDESNKGTIPSQRLKGQAFQRDQEKRRRLEQAEEASEALKNFLKKDKPNPAKDLANPTTEEAKHFGKAKQYADVEFPVLSMFRFHRKIIDEQTYLSAHQTKAIATIRSHSTWALSATPGIKDFEDVKRLASFVGVFLGVTDDTRAITSIANYRALGKERSQSEEFDAYRRDYSDAWHEHRTGVAQKFLDTFVSQNVRIGDKIEQQEFIVAVAPTPLHRAIIAEQQAALLSDQFRTVGKVDQGVLNPRDKRFEVYKASKPDMADARLSLLSSASFDSGHKYRPGVDIDGHYATELEERKSACVQIKAKLIEQLRLCRTMLYLKGADERWEALQTYLVSEEDREVRTDELLARSMSMDMDFQMAGHTQSEENVPPGNESKDNQPEASNAELPETDGKPSNDNGNNQGSKEGDEPSKGNPTTKAPKQKNPNEQMRDAFTKVHKYRIAHMKAIRANRYMEAAYRAQVLFENEDASPNACDCGCIAGDDSYVINAMCGHTYCEMHFAERLANKCSCGVEACQSSTDSTNIVRPNALTCYNRMTSAAKGHKFDDIVRIIQHQSRDQPKAKALVFCQFERDANEVYEALCDAGISVLQGQDFQGTVKSASNSQQAFEDFRKLGRGDPNWKQVMILNPTDSSAAGHNLTNASVVIYVSPLLTYDEQASRDFYVQATGRIMRPGQKRLCKVYHMLTLDTIDVNIFQERRHCTLPFKAEGRVLDKILRIEEVDDAHGSTFTCVGPMGREVVPGPDRDDWKSEPITEVNWEDYPAAPGMS